MRAYRFARETGLFIGSFDLDESDRDPIDPDRFLVPGDATLIAPPACSQSQHVRFDGIAWHVSEKDRDTCWAERKAMARAGLHLSDRVALQCFKHGVAFPSEWRAFDLVLTKIIAAADDDQVIEMPPAPSVPSYNQGAGS